jgi:hypothetical protein
MKTPVALALTLLFGSRVVAHHAEVLFDHSRALSATGTVEHFLWANPHMHLDLKVADPKGKSALVAFDGGSVSVMKRNGWSHASVKVGDKLVISYYPRHDQMPGGQLITATLEDGTKLGWRPAPIWPRSPRGP